MLTVHWLLEFQPSGQEQMLWDLAELLHQQVYFLHRITSCCYEINVSHFLAGF